MTFENNAVGPTQTGQGPKRVFRFRFLFAVVKNEKHISSSLVSFFSSPDSSDSHELIAVAVQYIVRIIRF